MYSTLNVLCFPTFFLEVQISSNNLGELTLKWFIWEQSLQVEPATQPEWESINIKLWLTRFSNASCRHSGLRCLRCGGLFTQTRIYFPQVPLAHFFFFFSSIFVFQSHPSIYQMRLVSILSPHTQGHKTLIQLLTLSHPCDSFFTLNSSNHQLMHEPPTCSLVRSLPSVMTFLCGRHTVSDKQMMQAACGQQIHRICGSHSNTSIQVDISSDSRRSQLYQRSTCSISWIYFCTKWNCGYCWWWVILTGLQFKEFYPKSRSVRLFSLQ